MCPYIETFSAFVQYNKMSNHKEKYSPESRPTESLYFTIAMKSTRFIGKLSNVTVKVCYITLQRYAIVFKCDGSIFAHIVVVIGAKTI